MTRMSLHGVLALTGCLLVASLVCGGPSRRQCPGTPRGRRASPSPRRDTTPALLPGSQGPGVLVWQTLAGATHRQWGPL